jgi:branched-chain amino acid transport system ATP-binding protein
MSQANVLLQVQDLRVAYGGIQAVKGVSFEVREGELVSLIGSNGAGKTTTMKAITGSLPLQAGDIEYLGKSIQGQGPWDLVKQGLAMVPEGRGVFTRMSITENLQMGAYIRSDTAGIADDIEKMFNIFPRLRERKDQLAGTMSGGEQQMLAMGRALMSRPKVLLLDEPSMGLSPIMVDKIFEVIARGVSPGRDRPVGRAKRQPRLEDGATCLCHGIGRNQHARRRQNPSARPQSQGGLPRGIMRA